MAFLQDVSGLSSGVTSIDANLIIRVSADWTVALTTLRNQYYYYCMSAWNSDVFTIFMSFTLLIMKREAICG
jgi:hypothetical protein